MKYLIMILIGMKHIPLVKSRMCRYFYSLFIIEFTYCMYIIVNKATFMVNDTIKAITKNNIKLINTTSLSDSKSYLVKWQHISTTMSMKSPRPASRKATVRADSAPSAESMIQMSRSIRQPDIRPESGLWPKSPLMMPKAQRLRPALSAVRKWPVPLINWSPKPVSLWIIRNWSLTEMNQNSSQQPFFLKTPTTNLSHGGAATLPLLQLIKPAWSPQERTVQRSSQRSLPTSAWPPPVPWQSKSTFNPFM